MDDNEIYKIIGNIIENVKIIQTMYQDCIDISKVQFKETERKLVMEEIDKLNDRDKEIIMLRYGLNGRKEMTQKDVAIKLGISQSYISRIEKKVIRKLKGLVKV